MIASGQGWNSQPRNLYELRQQCAERLHQKLQDPHARAKKAGAAFPTEFAPTDAVTKVELQSSGSGAIQRRHPAVPVLPLQRALSASRSPSPKQGNRAARKFASNKGGTAQLQRAAASQVRSSSSEHISSIKREPSQPRWTKGGLFGEYRPLFASEHATDESAQVASRSKRTSPSRRSLGLQQRACRNPEQLRNVVHQSVASSQLHTGHSTSSQSRAGRAVCSKSANPSVSALRSVSPTRTRRTSPSTAAEPSGVPPAKVVSSRCDVRKWSARPTAASALRSTSSDTAITDVQKRRSAPHRISAAGNGTFKDASTAARQKGALEDVNPSIPPMPLFNHRIAAEAVVINSPIVEDAQWASNVVEEIHLSDCSPSMPSVLLASPCSPHAACAIEAAKGNDKLMVTVQRLIQENESLREAFTDASKRLERLEDERSRLLDEGIFDFANSVSGKPAFDHGLPVPVQGVSQAVLFSDKAATVELRRAEEELRSAVLSDENEELRQELVRTARMGESLEQQQQAAEDRMHALEQEKVWLAERAARLAQTGETNSSTGSAAVDAGTGAGVGSSGRLALSSRAAPQDVAVAEVLEDVNRSLRVELADACRRHDELVVRSQDAAVAAAGIQERTSQAELHARESAAAALEELTASEIQRRKAEQSWTEERVKVISDLGGKAELLQQQLQESEARAQALVEENSRLQAALVIQPTSAVSNMQFPQEPAETAEQATVSTATDLDFESSEPALVSAPALAPLELELDEAW